MQVPSLAVLGEINECAYDDQTGTFGSLVRALRDDRVRTHGLRERDACVCVALTVRVDNDLGIQYVATEADHRRSGLASRLLLAVAATAREEASPDGLSLDKHPRPSPRSQAAGVSVSRISAPRFNVRPSDCERLA